MAKVAIGSASLVNHLSVSALNISIILQTKVFSLHWYETLIYQYTQQYLKVTIHIH